MNSIFARISVLLFMALAIASVSLFSGHASAGGATFVVTKEADTNDGTCDADCSAREAFVAAMANGGTVQFPAGTFKITIEGADENLAATGDFDITKDVTITGMGPDQTFLDGNGKDRVIDVRDGGSLIISGLTVQHGKVGTGAVAGMRVDGPLVMSNVHVVNNEGDGDNTDGATGGITVNRRALIVDSVISNNVATGNSTGGLYGTDTSDVTIRNTIIEGNSVTGDFPTGGLALRGAASLYHVTVKDNKATGKDALAGMFVGDTSVLLVRDSQFLNNDAIGTFGVGAILSRGQMTVIDTLIDGNSAKDNGVGGLLTVDNDGHTSSLLLRRTVISDNTGTTPNAVGGAAIQTPATLSEVIIDGNTVGADATGGIVFFGADPVVIDRTKIINNSAGAGSVAGLNVLGASNVSVFGSVIDSNDAGGQSTGGVNVSQNSTATIVRTAVTNNSTSAESSTGGVNVYQGTAHLQNVTISGNSAVGNATGGAYVDTGTLTLSFVTIANNSAGNNLGVGGLTNYGTLSVENTILGANAGEDNCFQVAGTSLGHNIDIGSTCGFTMGTDHQNADPQLSPLGDHGGFSQTMAIVGPPALDAGECGGVNIDQRVVPRPQGTACDIGAFEFANLATTTHDWGDLLCDGAAGPEDALALIAQGAGVEATAAPAGAGCPVVGGDTYVAGWFLHRSWGDVNCSGLVDVLDALAILQGAEGLAYPSDVACPKVGDAVDVGLP